MTLDEVIELLVKIRSVHPEMGGAHVYFGLKRVRFIGIDNKHKPDRVKLSEE